MKYIVTALVVLTIFLCIFNYPSYSVFDLNSFLEWCESFDSPPGIFAEWESETNSWWDKLVGGALDIMALLTFPIRFLLWLIPIIIDFVRQFVLYGVSF